MCPLFTLNVLCVTCSLSEQLYRGFTKSSRIKSIYLNCITYLSVFVCNLQHVFQTERFKLSCYKPLHYTCINCMFVYIVSIIEMKHIKLLSLYQNNSEDLFYDFNHFCYQHKLSALWKYGRRLHVKQNNLLKREIYMCVCSIQFFLFFFQDIILNGLMITT